MESRRKPEVRGAGEPLTIPAACNGPRDSGNGGYAAGVFARFIDGPAVVSLRSPVPLDTRLDAVPRDDGSVHVTYGETLVAEVRPDGGPEPELVVPDPVSLGVARRASEAYRGTDDGPFSRCFVCGRAREDNFGVFAGAVEGTDVVASPWTPDARTADAAGSVRPEFLWAVLDCPTYFALYPDSHPMSFLVRIGARIEASVGVGAEHVVMAWPIERDGRKHHAGSAVVSADGELLAAARVMLIDTGGG